MIGEATDMFRYPSCNFRNDFSKRKAARLVVNREFKVSKSYTLETSLFGYLSDDRQTVAFTEYLLVGLGEVIIASIQKYVNLLDLEN